jgi:hypothetical protein
MSKKNSKAARRKRHAHAVAKEKTDDAKRAEVRDRKAANRVRRMSSIMAEESDRAQMEAAARAVPESDAALMPPPPAFATGAATAAAAAAAAATDAAPRVMKKPIKRKVLKAPGANLLLATFMQGAAGEMAMDTEEQQPKPRERKMSRSFEVALRYDAIAQHRGPSKAIRKRAKGPKAIAAITNRLQRAAAKRAKAMALE